MTANVEHSLTIDLNQFKLHLNLDSKTELTLHFDSPSRRFYLSIIGLVVHVMKTKGQIITVSLEKHLDALALLNETVGAAAGSSDREHLLPRIYRKWKDALPDLENAPLFKVVGRKKRYAESADRVYLFSETVKDNWANLFDYTGSHENVRLRFSIDRLGLGLDDVLTRYGNADASTPYDPWEKFIAQLKAKRAERSKPNAENPVDSSPVPAIEGFLRRCRAWVNRLRWPLIVASCLFCIALLSPILQRAWQPLPNVEKASIGKMAFPLPEKPSIAVLPFRNLSADPEQEYFCDGLTQDIITGLSKISDLFVIATHSSFAYKEKSINLRQVSEELGVRHLLEGSVRRSGDRIRITVQLFDMIDATTLWAERYDQQLQDIFAIQDQITISILSTLITKLNGIERSRVLRKSTQNLQAYLKVLEGIGAIYLFKNDEGLMAFDEAITLDPRYAEAHAWKSLTHMRSCLFGPRYNRVDHLIKAIDSAKRCKALDEGLAACNMARGLTYLFSFDYINALREERRAVERWPNSAPAAVFLALALRAVGRYEEALEEIERALRLDPIRPVYAFQILGLVYFEMERYEEAIEACQKAVEKSPLLLPAYMVLALAYQHQRREKEARSAVKEILRIRPDFTVGDYTLLFPTKTVKDVEATLNGLLDDVKKNK